MTKQSRLAAPRLSVLMDDGAELTAQALNIDLLMFEDTARKRRWGPLEENQIRWMTFVAWQALTREKQIPAMTWEEWQTRAHHVYPAADDDGDDFVDPTQPGPGPA